MENENILNDIAVTDGTVFDASVESIVPVDDVVTVKEKKMSFAYGDTAIAPGDEVIFKPTVDLEIEKKAAEDLLIKQHAMAKLKAEQDAFKKKSLDEKVKAVFIDSVLRSQKQEWFDKYHYAMDGQTYRRIRKTVERNYGKGIYKPTPQQYDDIVYHINLSSSEENKNENNPMLNKASAGQNVNALMSTI